MSYHLCTGLQVPAAYNSTLTEKCDSENNTFDDLVSSVYFFTYLVFGSMVMYENAKRKLDKGNSNVQRSLHILINNKLFFWRMTSCILTYQVWSLTCFIYVDNQIFGENFLMTGMTLRLITVCQIAVKYSSLVIIHETNQAYMSYNDSSIENLTSYPGYLVVYFYHFGMVPWHIVERYIQIKGHEALKNHLKRKMEILMGWHDVEIQTQC